MQNRQFFILFTSLVAIVLSGTIFFHYVEDWSWIDSYFFTVVTLSTVGYGNIVPITDIGKIATTILIFSGLGIFALTIQNFASFAVSRRIERAKKRLRENREQSETRGDQQS